MRVLVILAAVGLIVAIPAAQAGKVTAIRKALTSVEREATIQKARPKFTRKVEDEDDTRDAVLDAVQNARQSTESPCHRGKDIQPQSSFCDSQRKPTAPYWTRPARRKK